MTVGPGNVCTMQLPMLLEWHLAFPNVIHIFFRENVKNNYFTPTHFTSIYFPRVLKYKSFSQFTDLVKIYEV